MFLVEHPGKAFTAAEIIEGLRVSEAVVRQSADNLSAAGLALVSEDGSIALPAYGKELSLVVAQAIDLYRKSPDRVRRLIVAGTSPGLAAFADAFRLRRD